MLANLNGKPQKGWQSLPQDLLQSKAEHSTQVNSLVLSLSVEEKRS